MKKTVAFFLFAFLFVACAHGTGAAGPATNCASVCPAGFNQADVNGQTACFGGRVPTDFCHARRGFKDDLPYLFWMCYDMAIRMLCVEGNASDPMVCVPAPEN